MKSKPIGVLLLLFSLLIGGSLFGQDITITQNLDPSSVNVNSSTRCRVSQTDVNNNPSLILNAYYDNHFARSFDLQNDHGIDTDFNITSVDIGVRRGQNIEIEINLYTANTTDLSDSNLDLSELNSVTYDFSSANSTNIINFADSAVINIPITASIQAGHFLVVEVFAPGNGNVSNQDFAIGNNSAGQTKPSYLKAPNCSTPKFVDASSLGNTGQNYVMVVNGEVPFDYEWTGEFNNNFNTTFSFTDGAAGPVYRKLTVAADNATDQYIVEGTSATSIIHKWFNTSSPKNQVFELNHGDNTSDNSSITSGAINTKHYTYQIEGFALPNSNRDAIIMETTNAPVAIDNISFIDNVASNLDVAITVNLSGSKSTEEKAFVRYSDDEFATSQLAEVIFNNPTDATGIATIPASFNTGGLVEFYAYTTTVNAVASSNHDLISLSIDDNSGAFYDYNVNSEYITKAGATHWVVPTSWLGNNVPPDGANVIIAHDLNVTDNNRQVQNLSINDGVSLNITSNNTLNIRNTGSITTPAGTGSVTGNGFLSFMESGSVNGILSLNNVILNNGGVDFGNPSDGNQTTINGSLTINSNAFVNTNSPIYGENSTLIYNMGGDFGRSSEWSNAGEQGRPHHVIIQNNTTIDVGSDPARRNIAAEIDGDFTIEAGSAFYMDFGTNNMEAPLIVGGDFLNEGAISLSGVNGGDLKVFSDFTNNATFNFNNRALIFEGNAVQNLTAANDFEIPFLVIAKLGGEVNMQQNIILIGNGPALQMSDDAILNLNGNNLVIGETGTNTSVDFNGANCFLKGSETSFLTLKGNADMGDIAFDPSVDGTSNALANIYLEKANGSTVGFSNQLFLKEGISLTGGTLNSNGNLTFSSDATRTAIIREVLAGGGDINGNVIIERYFSNIKRSYRYVSSAVSSTENIHTNWQEGQNNTGFDYPADNSNTKPGYGTHITGSTNGDNGFDATETGNESMFTWDNLGQSWNHILNTDATNLILGQAYALMVRGDRSTNMSTNTAQGGPTVLRSTGTIEIGSFSKDPSEMPNEIGDFALIGNPYQAQVDVRELTTTGLNTQYMYIWDPNLGGQFGGYATVDLTNQSNTLPSETVANERLQPGQAFFMETNVATSSYTFEEADKTDDILNVQTFSIAETPQIYIQLKSTNSAITLDATRAVFGDNFSNDVTDEDGKKLWNFSEYLAIEKQEKWLSINKMPLIENDTIQLFTGNYRHQNYELQLQIEHLEEVEVQLIDHYLDQTIPLENGNNAYSFSIDQSISESLDARRFEIVLAQQTMATDTFVSSQIQVYPNPATNGKINLSWPVDSTTETTTQITLYDVLGKAVWNQENTPTEALLKIDVSTLPTGIYVLKANRGTAEYTTKVLVE